ncbi:MAG: hypothetical protein ACI4KM_02590 [Oscillospiraceae bacterium]
MTALNQYIKGELSDDELDNVAGGDESIAIAAVVVSGMVGIGMSIYFTAAGA